MKTDIKIGIVTLLLTAAGLNTLLTWNEQEEVYRPVSYTAAGNGTSIAMISIPEKRPAAQKDIGPTAKMTPIDTRQGSDAETVHPEIRSAGEPSINRSVTASRNPVISHIIRPQMPGNNTVSPHLDAIDANTIKPEDIRAILLPGTGGTVSAGPGQTGSGNDIDETSIINTAQAAPQTLQPADPSGQGAAPTIIDISGSGENPPRNEEDSPILSDDPGTREPVQIVVDMPGEEDRIEIPIPVETSEVPEGGGNGDHTVPERKYIEDPVFSTDKNTGDYEIPERNPDIKTLIETEDMDMDGSDTEAPVTVAEATEPGPFRSVVCKGGICILNSDDDQNEEQKEEPMASPTVPEDHTQYDKPITFSYFNGTLAVRCPGVEHLTIRVHNILGQEIPVTEKSRQADVQFYGISPSIPSGVYLVSAKGKKINELSNFQID